MIGATFVALATAWTVVAADAIAESARTDGRSIVVFGTTLGNPGSPGGIWILIGAAIVAMLLWAIASSSRDGCPSAPEGSRRCRQRPIPRGSTPRS